MSYRIDEADVLDWLANYDGPPFHAVLSDPPYGLAFMGREWDSFGSPKEYQDWVLDWAADLLEHLYPGAVCLFFGGTRMWHRLACGLEDAGFEVYDTLMWLYGQGFPKSHDVSKAIDKRAGAEREVVEQCDRRSIIDGAQRKPRLGDGDSQCSGRPTVKSITIPATTDAERFDGYGSALKPAWEPVILCRKPRTMTYAEHALEHGTGALNIDGCRIGTDEAVAAHRNTARNEVYGEFKEAYQPGDNSKFVNTQGRWPANLILQHHPDCVRRGVKRVRGSYEPVAYKSSGAGATGERIYNKGATDWREGKTRIGYADADGMEAVEDWDCAEGCPVAMLDAQSGELRSGRIDTANQEISIFGGGSRRQGVFEASTGGASRFFYTAKASRSERNAGLPDDMQNKHPTIKPLSITEYLARLVLPPELDEPRRILVPFAGSGSEMIGAGLAGWDEVVGVEMNGEAIEIAEHRLAHWLETRQQGALL